jgi:hypothetical protein
MATTVTPTSLRTLLPEFKTTPDPTLQAGIDSADRLVSNDSYGDKRDDVVLLTAAHTLALSPAGRNAKLSTPDGKSTYLWLLRAYKLANSVRLRFN